MVDISNQAAAFAGVAEGSMSPTANTKTSTKRPFGESQGTETACADDGYNNLNDIVKLTAAYHFAAGKHVAQRRKGEAAEPYMNHLTEVAELVARSTNGADPDIIIAAVLHDTVEDTSATLAELTDAFGERVASLVAEVTDDKALPKAERKRLQIEHARHASKGAKLIKIADKTSNLRSLAASPPADWSEQRRAEYAAWSGQVVAACRGANPWLEEQFDAALAKLAS